MIPVVAYDSDAILPSIQKINDAGIKAIAYDVQFEDPNALYITFDNVGVGRIMAQEILKVKPEGNLPSSRATRAIPNATFPVPGPDGSCSRIGDGRRQDQERLRNLHRWLEAGQCPEEHGAVPDLDQQQGRCGAVRERRHGLWVCRGSRPRVSPALPVTGQDGDLAAINRVALGTQTVSVWKNSVDLGTVAAKPAIALADGADPASSRRDQVQWRQEGRRDELDPARADPIAPLPTSTLMPSPLATSQGTGLRRRSGGQRSLPAA